MKEILDSITEFLEENLGDNYILITAGAAAVLLLIIIIAIAAGRKKKPETEPETPREFFLEGEYDTMIRDAAFAGRTAKAEEPAEVTDEQEPEEGPEEEVTEVTEVPAEEQDALKEELQQVHININIERGQVRIGYEEDGKVTCIVETDEEVPEADPELTAALAAGGDADETLSEEASEGREVLASQGIILEKINLVKAAPAKKFGPDNFNTGRSGRVFTEEELREQIKQ